MSPMKAISVIFVQEGCIMKTVFTQSATALTFIMKEKEKAAPLF